MAGPPWLQCACGPEVVASGAPPSLGTARRRQRGCRAGNRSRRRAGSSRWRLVGTEAPTEGGLHHRLVSLDQVLHGSRTAGRRLWREVLDHREERPDGDGEDDSLLAVSCSGPTLGVSVDRFGNVFVFHGRSWKGPTKIGVETGGTTVAAYWRVRRGPVLLSTWRGRPRGSTGSPGARRLTLVQGR